MRRDTPYGPMNYKDILFTSKLALSLYGLLSELSLPDRELSRLRSSIRFRDSLSLTYLIVLRFQLLSSRAFLSLQNRLLNLIRAQSEALSRFRGQSFSYVFFFLI